MLQIKNMVCPRCVRVVRDELESLGLQVLEVELGRAVIAVNSQVGDGAVEATLVRNGFELLRDKREELVENIKLAIIDLIYSEKLPALRTTVSTWLAEELGKDYSTISTAFKASEGIALNRYVVLQKVEHAKELLAYDELSLSDIATKLGYKSLQHLSSQFKEVTGVTPNSYRKQDGPGRQPIDNLY